MSYEEGIILYVILGLGFFMLYLAIRLTPRRRAELEGQGLEVFPERERRRRVLEYKIFHDMVQKRENSTILVGSIFTSASFLILGATVRFDVKSELRAPLVFTSLILYGIWLCLFQCTSTRLDETCYDRMVELEGDRVLAIRVHRYMRAQHDSWVSVRRLFWFAAYILLFLIGLLVLFVK